MRDFGKLDERLGRLREIIPKLKVLILGDLILDKYLFTEVNRVSPEAPIPIAKYQAEEARLGGAGNVAQNVKKLGAEPILIGQIGADENGRLVQRLMNEQDIMFCPLTGKHPTITKVRILSGGQQLLRVDYEEVQQVPFSEELKSIVDSVIEEVDLVLVSDYCKGFVTEELVQYVQSRKPYTAIDAKPASPIYNSEFSLIKPNFDEALAIAKNLGINQRFENTDESVELLGGLLFQKLKVPILITRSDQGASYIATFNQHVKIQEASVLDVTGAGDTCFSVFAILHYLNTEIEKALQLMNVAAKITISNLGVYAPNLKEILIRYQLDIENDQDSATDVDSGALTSLEMNS